MIQKAYSAGNKGDQVRSDCHITLQLFNQGGQHISLKGKVNKLYGNSIKKLCTDILNFYNIPHCKLDIEDAGALSFVIAARLEAAIIQAIETDKEFLPEQIPENNTNTTKDRIRRSRLYLPGNSPKFMINAGIHNPDGIILDLEDSVAPDKKAEARILVRNALRQIDFYRAELMVRINQLPMGLADLNYIVTHNVHVVLIPKCESGEQIELVDDKIKEILQVENSNIYFMPIIESALGVVKAYEIASASENIVGLAIGLEDYTADIGTQRTVEGQETLYARNTVVNAAIAAGVQPIDSVFSDVSDMNALISTIAESKKLGFKGMGCIHPRQIPYINEGYLPNETEIEKAKKIVVAFDKAKKEGLGVVSLGSKMIDKPVVDRAIKTIDLAIKSNKLDKNWKKNDG